MNGTTNIPTEPGISGIEALNISINGISKVSYNGEISKTLDITLASLGGSPLNHTHTKTQITDFPTSLPANGGNASTVGGMTFVWEGHSGEQPPWIWGGEDSINMRVYDPSTLHVGYAVHADKADHAGDYYWTDLVPRTKVLPSGVDIDTIITSGFYRIHSDPVNVQDFSYAQMLVMRGLDTMTQLVFDYSGTRIIYRSGNPTNIGGIGRLQAWRNIVTSTIADYSLPNVKSTSPPGDMLWAY